MANQSIKKTVVAIRDQLGKQDDINVVGVWDYDETIGVEELSTVVKTRDLTGDSIWDNSTLGVWDVSLWDEGYNNEPVVQRVVNPDNTFRYHFRDTIFQDTDYTDNSWDTTNFRWEFKVGDEGRTLAIFKNQEAISNILSNLIIEGVSVTTQIDKTSFPAGFQKDIT